MLNFSRWKILSILFAVLLGAVFALPNIVAKETWSKLPLVHQLEPMVLGLDLQGALTSFWRLIGPSSKASSPSS